MKELDLLDYDRIACIRPHLLLRTIIRWIKMQKHLFVGIKKIEAARRSWTKEKLEGKKPTFWVLFPIKYFLILIFHAEQYLNQAQM